MLDDLRPLSLFVKTVELGSFKACAKFYNLSPSVVSYHLSQLEEKYNAPLLYRSTRKITPTPQGVALYEFAQNMVENAELALSTLNSGALVPRGSLRLSLPAGLIGSPFNHSIADFIKQYPQIEVDITYTDLVLDMIETRIDLAVRTGKMTDSNFKTLHVGEIHRTLVCAPDYINKKPLPTHPRELSDWRWIKLGMLPGKRIFSHPQQPDYEVSYKSTVQVNSVAGMLELTRQGVGISSPPDYMVENDIKTGALVPLLPDWKMFSLPVQLLWHNQKTGNPLVTLLVKHIKDSLVAN